MYVRIRSAVVSFVFCGYSVGAIVAALTSRSLLPTAGWEPVFWLAGIPLSFLPFMMKSIPESIGFLVEKGKEEKVKGILNKLDPSLDMKAVIQLKKQQVNAPGSPVTKLFEEKRALSTLMFWISCFSAFVLIYSMNTWLPRFMMQSGYDLSSSLTFTAVMQLGAIAGTLIFGRLVDNWGFKKVLVPLFFCGAIALSLIGFTKSTILAFIYISVIGASSVGVQNLSNAFVSQYYPFNMRSTAFGSTMAFGRMGGIVAPTFVGFLLSINLMPQFNFAAIATAAILGGFAMLFVQEKHGNFQIERNADRQENLEMVK